MDIYMDQISETTWGILPPNCCVHQKILQFFVTQLKKNPNKFMNWMLINIQHQITGFQFLPF